MSDPENINAGKDKATNKVQNLEEDKPISERKEVEHVGVINGNDHNEESKNDLKEQIDDVPVENLDANKDVHRADHDVEFSSVQKIQIAEAGENNEDVPDNDRQENFKIG